MGQIDIGLLLVTGWLTSCFPTMYCYDCNSTLLFDVLMRDFRSILTSQTFQTGQLPASEDDRQHALSICSLYRERFEQHRFLLQACFENGDLRSSSLQHRMAGVCRPDVLELARPHTSCLHRIYTSRRYAVCMAASLQFHSGIYDKTVTIRYDQSPYNCITIRQSVQCALGVASVHCGWTGLDDLADMFEQIRQSNAVVEGHFRCPLWPVPLFNTIRGSQVQSNDFRGRLLDACQTTARSASWSLINDENGNLRQLIRELVLAGVQPQLLSNMSNYARTYFKCVQTVGFADVDQPLTAGHRWMLVLADFLELASRLRAELRATTDCSNKVLQRTASSPCFQCPSKFRPDYSIADFRRGRLTLEMHVLAAIDDDDPLGFCRAAFSVVKFLRCLLDSLASVCQATLQRMTERLDRLDNDIQSIYGCSPTAALVEDIRRMTAFNVLKSLNESDPLKRSSFCSE